MPSMLNDIFQSLMALFRDAPIDITPDLDTMAMLDQPAACDKHRELVDAAAIEALQARIVARGGTVRKTPAEHAAALKERNK